MLRATPRLDGVNIQQRQMWWGRGRGQKGEGKGRGNPTLPGPWSNRWGEVWNSKGEGNPGRGHCLGGDQWGQARCPVGAPSAAFAVASGKGSTLPWGGRGRGWDRGVPLAPYLSNPPGRSPKGEGPTLPSNRKKWWGEAWNSKGKGHLGKGHCLGGDQWGQAKYPVGAPSAAFAVASGKGARLWCGRGSGWNRGVPLAPYRSNLPGSPLRREGPASPGSNGGRVWEGEFRGGQQRALNDQGKGGGEWQWRGKTIIRGWERENGNHTVHGKNYRTKGAE